MRGVLCVVFALASVSAAGAQLVQNPEMIIPKGPALEEGLKVISLQAVDLTIPVTDAQRVPYVLRQLQLSEDQKARIQPLVAEYLTNPEAHKKELERRDRVKQLRESQKTAKPGAERRAIDAQVNELKQQSDYRRFYQAISPILTDAQRESLAAAEQRIENNFDSAAIRPIDIIRIAESAQLSPDQQKEIRKTANHFRRDVNVAMAMSAERRVVFIAALIGRLHEILTDDQRPKFDAAVELMRIDRLPETDLLPLQ